MRWPIRLTTMLIVALGLLTWAASGVAQIGDADLRSSVTSPCEPNSPSTARGPHSSPRGPTRRPRRCAHSYRNCPRRTVLRVAACRARDFTVLAKTPRSSRHIPAERVGPMVRPTELGGDWSTWVASDPSAPGGAVHVTGFTVRDPPRCSAASSSCTTSALRPTTKHRRRSFCSSPLGCSPSTTSIVALITDRLSWHQ